MERQNRATLELAGLTGAQLVPCLGLENERTLRSTHPHST